MYICFLICSSIDVSMAVYMHLLEFVWICTIYLSRMSFRKYEQLTFRTFEGVVCILQQSLFLAVKMSLRGKSWNYTFLPSAIRQGALILFYYSSVGTSHLPLACLQRLRCRLFFSFFHRFQARSGRVVFGQTFPEFPLGTREFSDNLWVKFMKHV